MAPYGLTRISDDVHVKDNGQEHFWFGDITRLYTGTVTFASVHPVQFVNQIERDMRTLLERGKIEVIGRDPQFEGIRLLHDIEAQQFIEQKTSPHQTPELHAKLSEFRTVIIIRYTSGMTKMTDIDYHNRLMELTQLMEIDGGNGDNGDDGETSKQPQSLLEAIGKKKIKSPVKSL